MTILRTLVAGGTAFVAIFGVMYFFAACYRMGMGEVESPFSDRRNIAIFVIFSALAFLLCYQLVAQDHFVFYWDFGNYWTLSYTTMNDLFEHPYGAWKHICYSVAYDDYNLVLPLLLVLPLKLFGYTFLHYVMAVFTFFLLPAIFFLTSIAWKLLPQEERRPQMYAAILVLAFTFSALYGATVYGYADAGCLMPASLAVLLAVDSNILVWNQQQKRRSICIALLLVCTFLMRRYFAYFIVGYMAALVACTVPAFLDVGRLRRKEALRAAAKNLCTIGGTALVTLLVFCMPMVNHILTTDYSWQYEGYDLPFLDKIFGVISFVGLFIIAAAVVAVMAAVATGRWHWMTGFVCIALLVTTLYFFKVQAMGIQHVGTICVPLFLLLFLACTQVLLKFRRIVRVGAFTFLGAFLLLGLLHSFQVVPHVPAPLAFAYPLWVYHPLQRPDLTELHALADYLNAQTDPEEKDVYVLSSGETLNASIFDALDKPYGERAVHHLLPTHDTDLRDGFPTDFLRAGIVVVTDPVDLHLAPGTQEVVSYLADEVQKPDSPIGRHFQKDEQEFSLNGGRKLFSYHERRGFFESDADVFDEGKQVRIYRKVSDFTQEDLQAIADYYAKRYPGQENLFSDRIFSGGE